jgi:hypothetical protein
MELEKDLYKYLDILILESEIVEYNFARNFLYQKHIFPLENETHEFLEFCDKIVSLGSKLGYMKSISKEDDRFELTEKGISAKEKGGYFKYIDFIEKKELERIKPTIIAENYIGGNNHGIQSSFNNLKNVDIKQNIQPKANENKHNAITSFLSKFWWQILVPLTIVVIGILIEKGIIDIGI